MKKLLALILALVMVMGLATVGTNAALVDYTDADDFDFTEAVDVMSAVGVLQGADNMFRPKTELKRSEAAKIVAYLNTDNATAEGIQPRGKFSDVPTNHWAAGYIEYLDTVGVLTGRGNGVYDPDGQLLAIDFAKMLLVVLGYSAEKEGLVGSEYQINTSKLAMEAELFKGLTGVTARTVLTREQAAQMAFNAIKAPTVRYENLGGSVSINGADISFGGSDAVYVTTTIASAQNISKRQLTNSGINNTQSGYTVEFGEKQYPTLKLDKTTDGFRRPINDWSLGKDTIGKYIDTDSKLGEFTTAVTGADLFGLIGEARIKNTDKEDFLYAVNGVDIAYASANSGTSSLQSLAVGLENMVRNNVTPYWFTGNGVLTEVFLRDEKLYVTSIYTYYAKADSDYNPVNGTVDYSVWSYNTKTYAPAAPTTTGQFNDLDVNVFPGIEDMKEGDAFLVRVYKDGINWTPGEMKRDPKTVADEDLTEFTTSPKTTTGGVAYYAGSVKGSSTYSYAKTVYLDKLLRDYDSTDASLKPNYNLVFDWDGEYVIAATPVSTVTNYLFLAGLNTSGNNLATTEAEAYAIFDTGVGSNIKVNLLDTNSNIRAYTNGDGNATYRVTYAELNANTGHAYNRWFTYSVTGEGLSAVYTLKPVVTSQLVSANANTASFTATNNGTMTKTVSGVSTKVARFSAASTRLVGDYINDYASKIATNTNLSKQTAWFNQNSKIFTVGTDRVSPHHRNAFYDFSISKVTGIYEGIQGTDIAGFPMMTGTTPATSYSTTNPFGAVAWTVFDETSRYIKYAVIMGQDAAQTTNYLYAIDTVGSEELRSDGYYYWKLNAVVDGELKTVTVKSKYDGTTAAKTDVNAAIQFAGGGTTRNALFNATFDKDGNVTELVRVSYYSTGSDIYSNYQKSADVYTSKSSLREYKDHVVYNTYDVEGDTLWANGQTLYNKYDKSHGLAASDGFGSTFTSGTDIGLPIAAGARIWIVQQTKDVNTGLESVDVKSFTDLPKALGYLWASDSNLSGHRQTGSRVNAYDFHGYIAAGIDKASHTAKWVVIKNLNTIDVNTDQAAGSKVNASAYAVTSPTNTIIFELTNATLSGSNIQYEVRGHQNGHKESEDTLIQKGTIATLAGDKKHIAFGNVDSASTITVLDRITVGLDSTLSYKIIITDGNAVYQTDYVTPIGG